MFWVLISKYFKGIRLVEDETEHVDENYAEHTHWKKLIEIVCDGLKYILQGLVLHEIVEDVQHEQLLIIEGTE